MYRIGTDLVEIKRIEKSVQNDRFNRRVYSQDELTLFSSKKKPFESMAGNWAGKEAFSKALGTGVVGFSLNEVEILRDELNAPFIRLSGHAKKIADELKLGFSISITHTETLAQAVVIAWKKEENK